MTNRFKIIPAFWVLLAFFLLNSFLLNKILSRYQPVTVLDYSSRFVTIPVHGYHDSWMPMQRALLHLDEPDGGGLYQDLFFRDKVKFQYAPTSLLLIAPLKKLPLNHLTYAMNLLSWLLVCLTAFFCCRIFLFRLRTEERELDLSRLERLLFFILWFYLTVTFYPVVRSWRLGQVQTFNNFLFSVALWKYLRGARTLPGVLMGLVCALKPQYALLLIWGLVRRQKRFVLGLSCALGSALLLSVVLFGLGNHVDYLSVLSFIGRHGESFQPNQSMNGLLNRLFFNGNNLVWDAHNFPPFHTWVYAGALLTAVTLIFTSLFVRTRKSTGRKEIETVELMIAVLCFTMASPVAWEHHYGIMLPMFAYAFPAAAVMKHNRVLIAGLVIAYVLTSNYFQITDSLANSRLNVLQSYLYAGALLFLVCLCFVKRTLTRIPAR